MDMANRNRIACAINAINAVTTGDKEMAGWLIDIIEQLESISGVAQSEVRVDEWRNRNGRS